MNKLFNHRTLFYVTVTSSCIKYKVQNILDLFVIQIAKESCKKFGIKEIYFLNFKYYHALTLVNGNSKYIRMQPAVFK